MSSQRGTQICKKCKVDKPAYHFSKDRFAKTKSRYVCKQCEKYYSKLHYKLKRKTRLQQEKQNRAHLVYKYLSNHTCTDCSEDDIVVLEFDHLHSKRSNIARLIQSPGIPVEVLFNEIAKCEVVCANCHKRRTAIRSNWTKLQYRKEVLAYEG